MGKIPGPSGEMYFLRISGDGCPPPPEATSVAAPMTATAAGNATIRSRRPRSTDVLGRDSIASGGSCPTLLPDVTELPSPARPPGRETPIIMPERRDICALKHIPDTG